MRCLVKKKQFTNNTNIYTNADGVIIGISKSFVGSTCDITLLGEDPMSFDSWVESICEDSIPKEDRIRIWVYRGYQGTDKDLSSTTHTIPYKKFKNRRIMTAEQEYNCLVNSTRVLVKHFIGRIKHYTCRTYPYDGIIDLSNNEFNVITRL